MVEKWFFERIRSPPLLDETYLEVFRYRAYAPGARRGKTTTLHCVTHGVRAFRGGGQPLISTTNRSNRFKCFPTRGQGRFGTK